ncbi:MAG TPA: hypothetical protein VLG67_02615 [Candidatus Saccharimonadales bacterium]|nr:hypothetical protein [Candidatus Saccharimonadales bacterium]
MAGSPPPPKPRIRQVNFRLVVPDDTTLFDLFVSDKGQAPAQVAHDLVMDGVRDKFSNRKYLDRAAAAARERAVEAVRFATELETLLAQRRGGRKER